MNSSSKEPKFDLKSIKLIYVEPPPRPARPKTEEIEFIDGDIPMHKRVVLPYEKFRMHQLMNEHPNGKLLKEFNHTYYSNYPFDIFKTQGPSDELLKMMPLMSTCRMAYRHEFATHWRQPKYMDEEEIRQVKKAREDKKSQIVTNLKKLINECPNGLLGSDLAKKYLEMFGEPLDYPLFYLEHELELAASLPEIFHIVRPDVKDYLLLDARKELPYHYSSCDIFSREYDKHPSYPSGRGPEYSRLFWMRRMRDYVPKRFTCIFEAFHLVNIIGSSDEMSQLTFPLNQECVEVIVADIIDPSNFWIQVCEQDKNGSFSVLKEKIRAYYLPRRCEYRMPKAFRRANQMCVCVYQGEWLRACILKTPSGNSKEIEVLLIDCGKRVKVKVILVYLLDERFATLPAQAIKCSLTNVKPVKGQAKWSPASCDRFLEMVSERVPRSWLDRCDDEEDRTKLCRKKVKAVFTSFFPQIRSCNCELLTVIDDEDFHINNNLVLEGHAVFIDCPELEEPAVKP